MKIRSQMALLIAALIIPSQVGLAHSASADSPIPTSIQLPPGASLEYCANVQYLDQSDLLSALPALAGDTDLMSATWVVPQCVGALPPPTSNIPPQSTPTQLQIDAAGAAQSSNWSGFQSQEYDSQPWYEVSSYWTVPTLGGPSNPPPSGLIRTADWVGIGSGSSKSAMLAQAGTEQEDNFTDVTSQGWNQSTSYDWWWELFPMNSQQFMDKPAIHPGDDVQFQVYHAGSGKALFVVDNVTRNSATSFYETWGTSYTLDTSVIEWIFERPAHDGENDELPPISDSDFTGGVGVNAAGSAASIAQTNQTRINMQASCSDTTVIAQTSGLSNNGYDFSVSRLGWGETSPYPCPQ